MPRSCAGRPADRPAPRRGGVSPRGRRRRRRRRPRRCRSRSTGARRRPTRCAPAVPLVRHAPMLPGVRAERGSAPGVLPAVSQGSPERGASDSADAPETPPPRRHRDVRLGDLADDPDAGGLHRGAGLPRGARDPVGAADHRQRLAHVRPDGVPRQHRDVRPVGMLAALWLPRRWWLLGAVVAVGLSVGIEQYQGASCRTGCRTRATCCRTGSAGSSARRSSGCSAVCCRHRDDVVCVPARPDHLVGFSGCRRTAADKERSCIRHEHRATDRKGIIHGT